MFFKKKRIIQYKTEYPIEDLGLLRTRKEVYEFFKPDNLLAILPYWVGPSPILHLPANMLVMPGGHSFISEESPFSIALMSGLNKLTEFYCKFAPKNIVEMYGLKFKGLRGENLPPWEIPWLLRNRVPPSAEMGLGIEHGVSFYGPASDKKIMLEMKRLESIVKSIKKISYCPKIDGHIEGFLMQNEGEFRFFVLGGKHRTAALIFLGKERVPVRIRATMPRVIDRKCSSHWPLVKSGVMDEGLALKVFDSYFNCLEPMARITTLKN